MRQIEKSQTIRNRESWMKIIVILLFSFLIAWKFATLNINLDLSDFNFTDLLSLILALFAVSLSVLFYFKTIQTSNDFYDNTYKFTNDVSEILGRIEAGFGERLRHLDEGYAGLSDKFDRFPIDTYKVGQQVIEEKEEIKKKEEERVKLFESLAVRAKLEKSEKDDLFEKLHKLEKELNDAKSLVNFYEMRLTKAEKNEEKFNFPNRMVNYIQIELIPEIGKDAVITADLENIKTRFNSIKEELFSTFLDDMKRFDFVDSENNLTDEGAKKIIEFS